MKRNLSRNCDNWPFCFSFLKLIQIIVLDAVEGCFTSHDIFYLVFVHVIFRIRHLAWLLVVKMFYLVEKFVRYSHTQVELIWDDVVVRNEGQKIWSDVTLLVCCFGWLQQSLLLFIRPRNIPGWNCSENEEKKIS